MRRANLDLLIALLDAIRRRDRVGILELLAPAAVWEGIRPEWRCEGAEAVADMFLTRAERLDDTDLGLFAREDAAVFHLSGLRSLAGTDLTDGIYVRCAIAAGRIAGLSDHTSRRTALPAPAGIDVAAGVPEAGLETGPGGSRVPHGHGWFVLNVAEAEWQRGVFGAYTRLEGKPRFPRIGVNIGVLEPGQPACWYHREDEQEDFLVLSGECLLLVEEQERRLTAWDFVHCPPWTSHVFVGAGDGPCTILALGGRASDAVVYPRSALALRHRAGVEEPTGDPAVAYAGLRDDEPVSFRPEWLPGGR